jgi:hypothetical protein
VNDAVSSATPSHFALKSVLMFFTTAGGSLRECGRRESKNNDAGNESDEVRSHDKN